ncbi:hypothetical protein C5469_02890 [Photorhabdus cinerea]|uniref:XACb0070 ribbon-helix-helix domain-containing protein n=1 Tax=Photorhabdus cinerea TaxID=471575 RepID=A0A7X5QB54_9GAMM|nr:hypothetical protein [Photorhabdus cinerea]
MDIPVIFQVASLSAALTHPGHIVIYAPGDLSHFIVEAVRSHILELTAEQIKVSNADISEMDLTSMVDEALDWARKH